MRSFYSLITLHNANANKEALKFNITSSLSKLIRASLCHNATLIRRLISAILTLEINMLLGRTRGINANESRCSGMATTYLFSFRHLRACVNDELFILLRR